MVSLAVEWDEYLRKESGGYVGLGTVVGGATAYYMAPAKEKGRAVAISTGISVFVNWLLMRETADRTGAVALGPRPIVLGGMSRGEALCRR